MLSKLLLFIVIITVTAVTSYVTEAQGDTITAWYILGSSEKAYWYLRVEFNLSSGDVNVKGPFWYCYTGCRPQSASLSYTLIVKYNYANMEYIIKVAVKGRYASTGQVLAAVRLQDVYGNILDAYYLTHSTSANEQYTLKKVLNPGSVDNFRKVYGAVYKSSAPADWNIIEIASYKMPLGFRGWVGCVGDCPPPGQGGVWNPPGGNYTNISFPSWQLPDLPEQIQAWKGWLATLLILLVIALANQATAPYFAVAGAVLLGIFKASGWLDPPDLVVGLLLVAGGLGIVVSKGKGA